MGTKLQYAINPILNDTSFAANHLEDPNIKRSAFHKFEYYSMDKILEQHNIESIKKTMLIHEDIFQHQVRELHRLYNVQKRVIDEMKNEIKQNRFRGPPMVDQHSHLLNRHQPTRSSTSGYILHFQGVRDKDNVIPSPREQSGSCSGETLRKPIKGFDLERPAEEAISIDEAQTGPCLCGQIHSRNNNIMCIGRYDESTDVELTLSIGRSNNISGKKRSKSHDYEDHQRGDQELELGCSTHDLAHSKLDSGNNNAMSSTSSSSTIIEQQNKRSHWLFQGLSLNRS